jgi:hypothetical protein
MTTPATRAWRIALPLVLSLAACRYVSGEGSIYGPSQGKARTKVFGIEAEGFKFVYVLDRSGSMGESGALNAAKAQLLASLKDLGQVHQFQMVFYNQAPKIYSLSGAPGRLVFGNDRGKEAARRVLDELAADGATDHEKAIVAALRLDPDVIYLLTDFEDPKLSPEQLDRIERLNRGGAVIHAIEFGEGPEKPGKSALGELVRRSGGRRTYIDSSKLEKPKSAKRTSEKP